MGLDTGEELLGAALGEQSPLARAAIFIEPFIVPYDQLARLDGWVVWLGHPPVPPGAPILPIPDHLLWDEPSLALAAAAAVAADYAARRGADSAPAMQALLARESPVAVIVPGEITGALRTALTDLSSLGIPVLDRPSDPIIAITSLPTFRLRRETHTRLTSRLHDPALAFQQFTVDDSIGGDARSSFIVHGTGQHDGVQIEGDFDRRVGIEIGVNGGELSASSLIALERDAAKLPAFLNGVTSRLIDGALEIGWRIDAQPTPEELGAVFHLWLKALYGFDLVDVRIVFAPDNDDSPALAALNERADTLRRERRYDSLSSPSI